MLRLIMFCEAYGIRFVFTEPGAPIHMRASEVAKSIEGTASVPRSSKPTANPGLTIVSVGVFDQARSPLTILAREQRATKEPAR